MLPEEGAGPRAPTRDGAPRPGDAAGRLAALGIWSPGLLATLAEWPSLPLVTPRGVDGAASRSAVTPGLWGWHCAAPAVRMALAHFRAEPPGPSLCPFKTVGSDPATPGSTPRPS